MARRVNKRFLLILTIVVVGGLSILAGGAYYLMRPKPEKYIEAGDKFMAEKDYKAARDNYGQAYSLSKDPLILVKFGDAMTQLAVSDPTLINQDVGAWRQALEIDPNCEPALRRLMNAYEDVAELSPRAENFQLLRDTATKLAAVDPGNTKAAALKHLATIQAWLAGVQTDPRVVDDNVKALEELRKADPANAELPFYIAQVKVKRAQDAIQNGDAAGGRKLIAEALAVTEDSLKGQEQNPAMHYRAFQTFLGLSRANASLGLPAGLDDRATAEITKAREEAQPDNDLYVEINRTAADYAAKNLHDAATAEKIARALLKQRPDDPTVRVTAAELIGRDPAKRQEAISILTAPRQPDKAHVGTRKDALLSRQYEAMTLLSLAGLQIDEFASTTDAAKRKTLEESVNKSLKTLNDRLGEAPEILKLRGRLELAEGNNVKAIQTLEKSQQLLLQKGGQDYQVKYMLAKAYINAGQTGEAKKLLRQIVDRIPTANDARLQLVQLLLRERAIDEARPHVEYLEKVMPNSPDVTRMRLAMLDPGKDHAKIEKLYESLPEKSKAERLYKAQLALGVGQQDDAVRLLNEIVKEDPGDVDAVANLVRIYSARNEKDRAIALVAEARKTNPSNASLETLAKMLAGAGAEEIIAAEPDPFTRELNLAELTGRQGKNKEMLDHLKKAEAVKPDSARVQQSLLNYYLQHQNWDEARKYVDKLAVTNQDQANGQLLKFQLALAQGTAGNKDELGKAVTLGQQLTQTMPEFSQSWLAYGRALQASGRYDDALSKFLAALQRRSDSIEALRGVIDCYIATNRPQEAHNYILQAVKQFPTNADIVEQETLWQLRFGDPLKAVPQREAELKNSPNDPSSYTKLGMAYLRVAQVKGSTDANMATQYVAKAREVFTEAKKKWPDESTFYGNLADIALASNKPQDAEADLKELAARPLWKDKPEPQLMLAELYARTNRPDQAEQALRDAHANAPDNYEVRDRLANYLARRNKLDDALALLPAGDSDARVQRLRIDLLVNGHRLDDATKSIQAQLLKNPTASDWNALLGYVYYLTPGKLDDARKQLDKTLAADPKNANALYFRGLVALRQSPPDAASAVADLTAVRNINPDNVDVRMALADAMRLNGDTDRAITELEGVVRAAPQAKLPRLKLIELYASSNPPRWSDVDRVIADSRGIPQLAVDPDLLHQEALVRLQEGRDKDALAAIEEARKSAGNNPNITRTYLNVLLQMKQYKTVVQETGKIIQGDKDAWWAYAFRGQAKNRLKDKPGALSDFEAALETTPAQKSEPVTQAIINTTAAELGADDALKFVESRAKGDPRWLIDIAYLQQSKHDAVAAQQTVAKLMESIDKLSTPDRQRALRLAGVTYMTGPKPDYDKARDIYLKLLNEAPNSLEALNNLACLLAGNITPPRPEQARVYSQRAYDLMRKSGNYDPLIADTHGWVLSLCTDDDLPEAIRILNEVVDRRPFLEARYHLANAYLKSKNATQAEKQLNAALETIADADKAKQAVDPVLRVKITQAMDRVRELKAKADTK